MHPAQIKAALAIAGYRQTEAAKLCGVAPTTIGAVINGRSRSKAVEEWISEVTGESLEALWPQWYGTPESPLTADERLLVDTYRKMPPKRRVQLIAEISGDYEVERGTSVAASRGSIAAGGDVNLGKQSGRKK